MKEKTTDWSFLENEDPFALLKAYRENGLKFIHLKLIEVDEEELLSKDEE